jgi:hypothetical protein
VGLHGIRVGRARRRRWIASAPAGRHVRCRRTFTMADGNYLYGDSTAFPLAENFLETSRAACATSVALLRADEVAEEERRLVADAEQRTMVELIHLGKFARRVEDIYAHAADPLRAHVGSTARNMVGEMHREVLRWRDATVQKAMETAALSQVAPAIGRFFEKHQIPGTTWSVSWRAHDGGQRTSATVLAKVPSRCSSAPPFRAPRSGRSPSACAPSSEESSFTS